MNDDGATLEAALDMLRAASRQNSRKGAALGRWIQGTDPGAKWAASLVTEKKQAYNRVGEQFDRGATDVVFLAFDREIAEALEREVRKKWYAALQTVAIFTLTDDGYELSRLLTSSARPDAVASALINQYGTTPEPAVVPEEVAAKARERTDPRAELTNIPPALIVAWDEAKDNPPKDLVGVTAAYHRALAALQLNPKDREKNIILLGPPGVGKSSLAKHICEALHVECLQVTATAEWTTFETIGGYFPTGTDRDLRFNPGLVTRSMLENKWLIIDEINRADIDKCFGELFSVLSGQPVTLPYRYVTAEGDALPIRLGAKYDPKNETELGIAADDNWRIIGTMNTFDKASLFRMSAAFMRRFAFIEVPLPNADQYAELIRSQADSEFDADVRDSEPVVRAVEHLTASFASEAPTSLRDAELAIGPAIVIDVIRYLSRTVDELAKDYIETMLDTYRMFVLPQLEGRDKFYDPVSERLPGLLGLELLPDSFRRDLKDWLGHED